MHKDKILVKNAVALGCWHCVCLSETIEPFIWLCVNVGEIWSK